MISLDTETTGLDFWHGAKPYLVTTYNGKENEWWEWDVNPKTREPIVEYEDLTKIQETIDNADCIVLQNPKFDVRALQSVFLGRLRWDWSKVYDTLLAGHLLASNQPHDLTTMVLIYLGLNIQPYEDAVKEACTKAKALAQDDWLLAKRGLPMMPSAKEKTWKFDMWLPRAVIELKGSKKYPMYHSWQTVTSEYANIDSESTYHLFKEQRQELKKRGLWKIYLKRSELLPIIYEMEERGITLSEKRLWSLRREFVKVADKAHRVCVDVSGNTIEKLPVSGNSNALKSVLFDKFNLVSSKKTPKGNPSIDKFVLDNWLATLAEGSKPHTFISNLRVYRKRKTALGYIESYEKFWLPAGRGMWRVHPSLNPTGTDTLRFSASNPNNQQISKQEDTNLRYCFGPAPDREWWSLDAKNIELRIPAYEAGEKEMISLFEREDEPPYYGSYHMLVFDVLHPDKFKEHGMECKKLYGSTWYQWTKNGNFAVQYGAMEQSGTADRAYHVDGAQRQVQKRFSRLTKLNRRMIEHAERHNYVETIPDKSVDSDHGYPLLCTRSRWGKILPTVPLNYHVQGTAMWWMIMAMIRCQAYINELNAKPDSKGYYMIMQVHDELVFDFPRGKGRNLPKIRKIKRLMEQGGDNIGVPTPCSIEYHANNWSEGISAV